MMIGNVKTRITFACLALFTTILAYGQEPIRIAYIDPLSGFISLVRIIRLAKQLPMRQLSCLGLNARI